MNFVSNLRAFLFFPYAQAVHAPSIRSQAQESLPESCPKDAGDRQPDQNFEPGDAVLYLHHL